MVAGGNYLPVVSSPFVKNWAWYSVLLFLVAIVSAAVYLLASEASGFPLDDAWIHQVYARSLGLRGELAFNPGEPSSGSTAPAWSALLSLAYLLKVNPQLWAYLWGVIFHLASAMCAARLSYRFFGDLRAAWAVGVITVLEWHLAWGALSGMEISLFTFISILFLLLLERTNLIAEPVLVLLPVLDPILILCRSGFLSGGQRADNCNGERSDEHKCHAAKCFYEVHILILLERVTASLDARKQGGVTKSTKKSCVVG